MLTSDKFESPIERLCHWAALKQDTVYLNQPIGDKVINYTWSQVLNEVSCVAHYLGRYPRGSHIAIISLNCAHWVMADLAIQMAGHISIPIYPTASPENIGKILKHAEAKAVFLGKMFEPNKAVAIIKSVIGTQSIDLIGIFQPYKKMTFWQQLVDSHEPVENPVQHKANDLMSIIYTSGTTGDPKGVMVSYRAVQASMKLVRSVIVINQQDRFVSYLPLAHVAERMAVEFGSLFNGAQVWFIRSLDTFTEDVKAAQPTIFFGVPRIWGKIKLAIEGKLGGAKVLNKLLKVPVLGAWLKKALLKKLGFQNVRYALCAAAAVNKEVLQWYETLGLKLNEAYGMSETCGLSHMTLQNDTKTGSVGRVIDGCECQLSDSGEVLLRNPAMMDGYYKQADLTSATIDENGWLHTGDLGEIDADGFLSITGRVKDIFKTSKGKYIAPVPIEQKFQTVLGIEHAILMGDGFNQPFMVISTFETRFADDPTAFITSCQYALLKINPKLEAQERLSHIFISNQPWLPENGLLTPTLKMKRDSIEKQYQNSAEQLMAESNDTVIVIK